MKLTEPQKRVLRILFHYSCDVCVHPGMGVAWYDHEDMPSLPYSGSKAPAPVTVRALERRNILRRAHISRYGDVYYRLTPKGREVAKELQDEQD